MREIEFRGYYTGDSHFTAMFVYGCLINEGDGRYSIMTLTENGFECFHIETESIGQYTGMKDKDGVNIYEGDIIDEKYKYAVKWATDGWKCIKKDGESIGLNAFIALRARAMKGEKPKVIGNAYENPEL